MELFKAITEARSAAIVVERFVVTMEFRSISLRLTIWFSGGVLPNCLVSKFGSPENNQEANPWPNKLTALRKPHGSPTSQSFGFHPHDNDVQITVGSDEDLSIKFMPTTISTSMFSR